MCLRQTGLAFARERHRNLSCRNDTRKLCRAAKRIDGESTSAQRPMRRQISTAACASSLGKAVHCFATIGQLLSTIGRNASAAGIVSTEDLAAFGLHHVGSVEGAAGWPPANRAAAFPCGANCRTTSTTNIFHGSQRSTASCLRQARRSIPTRYRTGPRCASISHMSATRGFTASWRIIAIPRDGFARASKASATVCRSPRLSGIAASVIS